MAATARNEDEARRSGSISPRIVPVKQKEIRMIQKAMAAAVAFAAAALIGCGDLVQLLEPDDPVEPIRIGVIQPSGYFPDVLRGAELARTLLNESGGVLGRPVQFVVKDNQGADSFPTPTRTIQVGKELINEGVFAVLGPILSTNSYAFGEAVRDDPILTLAASSSPVVTEANPYMFIVVATNTLEAQAVADFAKTELGVDNISILFQKDDLFSMIASEAFAESYDAAGGAVVYEAQYEAGSQEFGGMLTAALADDPGALFLPSFAPEVPRLMRQARAMGFQGVFLGLEGWEGIEKSAALDDVSLLEGAFYASNFSPETPGASAETFISAYAAMYGVLPNGDAARSYDAMNILAQAIETVGELDMEAVRDAVWATENFNGATFTARFDENRRPVKDLVILRFQDGAPRFHRLIKAQP